ncbi:MAG TPA: outer membrane beta-barrel protein [Candidatus Eisenbacteria bacterium]|nr:outer membrane beta-barrel protein [Candidatus Eisenbacteria bacterium]
MILSVSPSPANAAEESSSASTTLLRSGTFASALELSSGSNRPIRRRAPRYYEERREPEYTPRGFLTVGGGVFDPQTQPGGGFYGSLSLGSEIAPPLDLGVQVSWFHRDSDGEQVVFTYVDEGGNTVQQVIETESVDTDLIPLMGIVRLRLPISPYFQPYVGGGAGYEWLSVEGVDEFGPFSYDYDGFGAQVMGGLNLYASKTIGLYGEATYNWSSPDRTVFVGGVGEVKEEIAMDGLAFHGGLRFRF